MESATPMRAPRFLPCLLALLFAAAVPAAISAAPAKSAKASPPWRVMSFNVRYATAPDGEDAWPKRAENLFRTIETFGPDLVGFQEVVALQQDALVARFPGYGFCGVARDDGKRKGEFSSIAYRKDRFSVVAEGTFWLSETPEVIASKSWDTSLTRICTWVRLKETATGREIFFANTHFDHRGVQARRESAKLISRRATELAQGLPAILTGDFNLNEDDPGYAQLVRPPEAGAIRWIDSYRTLHPQRSPEEASFNGFKGTVKGSRIDFVFHTAEFKATAGEIVRTAYAGRYPSDHYPVTAVLELK